MPKSTFVIVGGGVAAGTAASTLRASGFDGRLLIVGRETDPPYDRPTLSKERLRGEISDDRALFHPMDYYRSLEIELLLEHEVEHVSVVERTIRLANATAIAYDRVLIATGAHPRQVATPGTELPGVSYLRSLRDARELSRTLKGRPRVLVAGTGFIVSEVAASARALGCDVTLVGSKAPLEHVLGSEIGNLYTRYHSSEGVDVRVGTFVERFEGTTHLERAKLFDGSSVECDVAVIGIGVEPSLECVRNEPIETNDGILVDEYCRTSAPRVFAAGDVAFSWNPRLGRRLRVEHFDNAQLQAAVAAKSMLGSTDPYVPIPTFWSDQYSYKLLYSGDASNWDSLVFRGDTHAGSFSAFYLKDGSLQAICSVNRRKEHKAAQHLIGKCVEPQLLM